MNSLKSQPLPLLERSLNVEIGNSEYGKIYHNFSKYPHMIVAGTTGYGKTNFINCLISQLKGEVILIDMKGGFDYTKSSATNIFEAENQLNNIIRNMRKRRKEHIFVIVDEAGELLPPSYLKKKDEKEPYLKCLEHCSEIARIGRGFRVHLIYCTQYPTSDIVPRQIKQNCDAVLCFRLKTEIASRVVLDEEGAEQLPAGKYGLGIYKTDRKIILQTYLYTKREEDDKYVKSAEKPNIENTFEFE